MCGTRLTLELHHMFSTDHARVWLEFCNVLPEIVSVSTSSSTISVYI